MEAKKNLKLVEHTEELTAVDPKVISTIDVNIQWPSPREQFIEDYTFCALCGDELIYTHNTHFANSKVNEEAHCPTCNIRTKSNEHKLQ